MALKQLLQNEIPGIKLHRAKRVNESERVHIKRTRDIAIQPADEQSTKRDTEMKTLFDAAAVLGKLLGNARIVSLLGHYKT